jgi:hypothetical protein
MFCAFTTAAQNKGEVSDVKREEPEKFQFYPIPRENCVPVIAYQPESPIEFIKAEPMGGVEGGGFSHYEIRNRSSKPIRFFKVATINSAGTGSSFEMGFTLENHLFMPGEKNPWDKEISSEPSRFEIIPLTDDVRKKIKSKGMQGVVIFMVVKVEFADGTIFSDEKAFNALEKFFEDHGIFPEEKEEEISKKR